MNQASTVGFGTDANICAGLAFTTGGRLGNFDLVFENTGKNPLTLFIREHDGSTSPSGYKNFAGPFSIVAKGTVTKSFVVNAQTIGFFGSGNTTANISVVLRNPADLRGAHIDIKPMGKRGFGFEDAFDKSAFRSPGWGTPPDSPTSPAG